MPRLPVLFSLLLALPLGAEERPAPPKGYKWEACPQAKAELLLPEGWHRTEDLGSLSATCTLAPTLDRSLTNQTEAVIVTLLLRVPEKSGLSADAFAARLVEELARRSPESRRSSARQDPFFAYRVELTLEDGGSRTRIYQLAFANPLTGSVYLVAARAPESEWPRFWKKVRPILEQLGLDPEA